MEITSGSFADSEEYPKITSGFPADGGAHLKIRRDSVERGC
jgi:hypothetical protein